jgi:D-cysteine desulfhydrase
MTNPSDTTIFHAPLGTWPTPLEPMPRLARALGLAEDDLWIKRDDLTGVGGGGNKLRKLEWTCGAALAEGATTLVTTGAPQSNHARLTAAAGARLGLDVVLVLAGDPDSSRSGNIALDGLFGAQIVWAGDTDDRGLDLIANDVAEQLRRRGATPVLIPFGGSSPAGARGYVRCGHELLAQEPGLSTVVTAVGSGGTMAGLVASLGPQRVLGVHCGAVSDPGTTVANLVAELTGQVAAPEQLRLRMDQVGRGYSTLVGTVQNALTLTARSEGIVLDPIYTGRAMAGLIAAVKDGQVRPGDRVVFLHSGGLPGFFGHSPTLEWAQSGLATVPVDD